MAKAEWNDVILAESDNYKVVEGHVYFPPNSVDKEYLRNSDTDYECPWKGHADYYDIMVEGKVNRDAAWYYPDPKPVALEIKGYIAFDRTKNIQIEDL